MFTPAPISHSGMNTFAPLSAPGMPPPYAWPSHAGRLEAAKSRRPKRLPCARLRSQVVRDPSGLRAQWRHPEPIAVLLFEPQPRIEALGPCVAVGHLHLQA